MKRLLLLCFTAVLLLSGCAPQPPEDDGKITVALVDTGISTTAIQSELLLPGYNYILDSEDTQDRVNHGTAVASILAGCETAQVEAQAPFAYLVPLVVADKVDGALQQIEADLLAQVIRDAIDRYQADIINLSIGVKTDSPALKSAVDYAAQQGVLVIAAVGNGGDDGSPYYPAAYDSVLAVGSCDKNGKLSHFSQQGADVLAQGEDILLASRKGLPYGVKGTSFAAGLVSALAAGLLQAEPDLPLEDLRQQILDTVADMGGCLLRSPAGENPM